MGMRNSRTQRQRRYMSRARDRLMSPITKGLLLAATMAEGIPIIHSAAGDTGFSSETVDANGSYEFWRNGLIVPATLDTARMEREGTLAEGARMNRALFSEQFQQAGTWINSSARATVTPDDAVAPNGAKTADKIESIDAAETRLQQTIGATAAPHSFSVYLKPGTATWGHVLLWNGGGNGVRQWFNLATGVVGTSVPFGAGIALSDAGVEYVGGGWFRVWIVATLTAIGYVFGVSPSDADGIGTSAVGLNIHAWGAQLEAGSKPSSYMLTTTGTSMRAAENLQFDNAAAKHVKAASGTLACAVTPGFDGSDLTGDAYVFDTSDGADGVRAFYDQSNSGKLTVEVLSGGAPVATLVGTAAVNGATVVPAVAWKLNDFELYEDGVSVDTDAAGAAPTTIGGSIFIGQDKDGANHGFCRVAHLVSHNRRSTTGEVEQSFRTFYKELLPWID